MNEPVAPIDRITTPGPDGAGIELKPITVLLGDNNSGKSSFMGLLLNLNFNSQHRQDGPYKRWSAKDAVSVELMELG